MIVRVAVPDAGDDTRPASFPGSLCPESRQPRDALLCPVAVELLERARHRTDLARIRPYTGTFPRATANGVAPIVAAVDAAGMPPVAVLAVSIAPVLLPPARLATLGPDELAEARSKLVLLRVVLSLPPRVLRATSRHLPRRPGNL